MRIGVFPFSQDLNHPADRRRLIPWARARGHLLKINELKEVDVVYLSEKSQFSQVIRATKVPKVFDLIDGYLAKEKFLSDAVRRLSKVRDIYDFSSLLFSTTVRKACQRVDTVICSSQEQRETILPWNDRVFVILDNHSEIQMTPFAESPERALFWEGQTFTLEPLIDLLSSLELQGYKYNFVTDLIHKRALGRYFPIEVNRLLAKENLLSHSIVYTWSLENLYVGARNSSLGLLPVKPNPIQRLKPENRLLIMFRLGLPCLTSDIDSYERIEKVLGLNFVCRSTTDWLNKIERLSSDLELAEFYVTQGQNYLREFHTEEILFQKWDEVFEPYR